jgi:hypothetical protein
MAVTVKNAVFWDVTPCGSCKSRRFQGMYGLHHQGDKTGELGTKLAITSSRCMLRRNTTCSMTVKAVIDVRSCGGRPDDCGSNNSLFNNALNKLEHNIL